ncbi:unnamed protein product [Eruca vesicaria subsp. sativa]|uniref:Uncharacterized protein n=1 Tax=Eruca vesicaria subsp. sativa TaxID=29727 RepID=A0ABC8KF01_ERUVS|nr:unnamed protein product [Eruca vesicaria subsp. sativa]
MGWVRVVRCFVNFVHLKNNLAIYILKNPSSLTKSTLLQGSSCASADDFQTFTTQGGSYFQESNSDRSHIPCSITNGHTIEIGAGDKTLRFWNVFSSRRHWKFR